MPFQTLASVFWDIGSDSGCPKHTPLRGPSPLLHQQLLDFVSNSNLKQSPSPNKSISIAVNCLQFMTSDTELPLREKLQKSYEESLGRLDLGQLELLFNSFLLPFFPPCYIHR